MLTAGLTGGIATGKSSVGALFQELGAQVIEFDRLSREAVQPPSLILDRIAARFGRHILNEQGELLRPLLREIIFNDEKARLDLNQIIHPALKEMLKARLADIEAAEPRAIVLIDTPLLFEVGWQEELNPVILVYAPPQTQITRLMARDKIDRAAALAALQAQMPINKKVGAAQFVIDNSGTIQETLGQVRSVWYCLQQLSIRQSLK
ncbi:MAG: dephospho-CoA kinase [Desulfarculales bacterium]|jgi:dephospho-CoA kinase|nr:dephospho-CoA kinase [Desulfarculales bacterium]